MKQCSVCKKLYCSRECQKKDWKQHKIDCGRQLIFSGSNGNGAGLDQNGNGNGFDQNGNGFDQYPMQMFYPPVEVFQANENEEFGIFDDAEEDAENGSNDSNFSSQ